MIQLSDWTNYRENFTGNSSALSIGDLELKFRVVVIGDGGMGVANDINESGIVAGMIAGQAFKWDLETGLELIPGMLDATSVNDNGVVLCNDIEWPYLYSDGELHRVRTRGEAKRTYGHSVTNSGFVFGQLIDYIGTMNSPFKTNTNVNACYVLRQKATRYSIVFGSNDARHAVGCSVGTSKLSEAGLGWWWRFPVMWNDNGIYEIAQFQGDAYAINNHDDVGGLANVDGRGQGFVRLNGKIILLGRLADVVSSAWVNDLTDTQVVVGESAVDQSDNIRLGFVFIDYDMDGFLDPGELQNINDFVYPEDGYLVHSIKAVNESLYMVGQVSDALGNFYPALLVPEIEVQVSAKSVVSEEITPIVEESYRTVTGRSAHFDRGNRDDIYIDERWDIFGDKKMTVETWAKGARAMTNGEIFGLSGESSGNAFYRAWAYYLRNDGINTYLCAYIDGVVFEAPLHVPVTDWNHFAMTYDNQKIVLYVNGENVLEKDAVLNLRNTNAVLILGYYDRDTPNNYIEGYMDEFRLWNRARSSEEIEAEYCYQITSGDNLILSLTFDDDTYTDRASGYGVVGRGTEFGEGVALRVR